MNTAITWSLLACIVQFPVFSSRRKRPPRAPAAGHSGPRYVSSLCPSRLERSPSELNRGRDSRIGFDLLEDCRRAKEAAGMALSDDLRERVVGAVVEGGMSRNAAAKRFGVSIASAVRWVARFKAKGEISPAPTGGDRRSGRIEALRDYLFGLIGRRPDMTLLEIQER